MMRVAFLSAYHGTRHTVEMERPAEESRYVGTLTREQADEIRAALCPSVGPCPCTQAAAAIPRIRTFGRQNVVIIDHGLFGEPEIWLKGAGE